MQRNGNQTRRENYCYDLGPIVKKADDHRVDENFFLYFLGCAQLRQLAPNAVNMYM